ncbi:hypothetical protein ACFP1Z_06740 [Streptomyces gamaensis]|uniref:Uncharacterized protein n=1 Tax=Streptomyces gamaensis TaxID=1763542 RepID=A0ABW0YZQ3_9ACTN
MTPAALAEAHRVGGRWISVTLAYGQWDSSAGPFVAVTTLAPDDRSAQADPRSALTAAVELEEERYASLNDEQHPAASGPVDISEARVRCDSTPATAALGRRGALWALVLDLDSQRLVAVGSGVEPESVAVGQVQDLDPFLQGRSTLLQRMTEAVEHSAAPRPQPDVAGGAVRALAMAYSSGEPAAERRSTLWAAAVDELTSRPGESADRARQLATSMVNHIVHLAQHVPWFSADPTLRAAAVGETADFATGRVDVPSHAAQRAWDEYWHAHPNQSDATPDARRAEPAHLTDILLPRWIEAWNTWRERR